MKLRNLFMSVILSTVMLLVGCGNNKANNISNENFTKNQSGGKKVENKTSDSISIGIEASYPPYTWSQKDNSNNAIPIEGTSEFANGYDIMIAKRAADSMGKKLVIKKFDWDGLIPAVQSGIIDVVMAGMSPTKERLEQVDFTDPYYKGDVVVVVRKDSKYANVKSINDFKGAKITAHLNTLHYPLIEQMNGVEKLDALSDFAQLRMSVKSNIIDGYVADEIEGKVVKKAYNDLTYVKFDEGKGFKVGEEIFISAALKKGSPLKDEINKALKNINSEEKDKFMNTALSIQKSSDNK